MYLIHLGLPCLKIKKVSHINIDICTYQQNKIACRVFNNCHVFNFSGLLETERKRILSENLNDYMDGNKLPQNQCYVCFQPYHCLFVLECHVSLCEKKFGVTSFDTAVETTSPISSPKKIQFHTKLTRGLAKNLQERLLFDMVANPHIVKRWNYCYNLEREFKISKGLSRFFINDVLEGNAEALNFYNKTLDDEDVVELADVQVKKEPIEINLTGEQDAHIPVATPQPSLKCKFCGKLCASKEELSHHKNRDVFQRFMKRVVDKNTNKQIKPPVVQAEPEARGLQDLSKVLNHGKYPENFCPKCWQPYHCIFVYECHEELCKEEITGPATDVDKVGTYEEANKDTLLEVLTPAMVKAMKALVAAHFKHPLWLEHVGSEAYWKRIGFMFNVPWKLVKTWHTTFPAHKSRQEKAFKKKLAKVASIRSKKRLAKVASNKSKKKTRN